MNNPSNIERVVMRRVYHLQALRLLVNSVTASCLLLLVALWGIGREVWVAKVFENSPHDVLGRALYLVYAFEHTHLAVQVLSVLTLASIIYLAREAARITSSIFIPANA